MKTAVIAVLAAGMLCACENKVQPVNGTTEPLPASEPAAETEVESNTGNIVTTDVESVSVRYYVGYNVASGDMISDTIPCHTVEVSGEDLAKLAELLPEISKITIDPHSEAYEHLIYDHVMDYYELTINDDLVLHIGDEYGVVVSSDDIFAVPAELYVTVDGIAEEYNKKNVYSTLDVDQVTVTNMHGEVLEITDPEQLEMIKTFKYYTINADDEFFEGEMNAYVMDLHNGDRLEIHFASVIGKLCHQDGSSEYVYIRGMEDYLGSFIPN
ncbi:MAG: hypothetical protein IKE92_02975 [Clostridiales bacterium]|nr:hypothetical protein [Clostridiales bacterium]